MRHTFLRIETSIAESFLLFEFRPKNLGSVPKYSYWILFKVANELKCEIPDFFAENDKLLHCRCWKTFNSEENLLFLRIEGMI